MRRLNKVLHISNQNHLLLRVSSNLVNTLNIGDPVVTQDLTKIGRIFDIFGPVNHPYISIQPNTGILERQNVIGEVLYSFEEKKSRKRKR